MALSFREEEKNFKKLGRKGIITNSFGLLLQVLAELKSYATIAETLSRLAVQLVAGGSRVKSVKVNYATARAPDDLDT